ncbi:hypothetical protein CHO01_31820 [Cellulomonas hominis]|uniref:Uncharacterized protein n=1 Tax=Cellulomonas hominis TaxID=156981 RepID=A0A511FFN9_9CELL|nr:hypothetical protein [Cellulomonas hominis]MBB5474842.1 hypothetical protein [Cellulomonas hominis]GEL48066.1 hypothetical protein CHO01_31820 [Cellulomonas hominis]
MTNSRDVSKGASADAASGLGGSVLVQTCYRSGDLMRLVALTKVG